MEGPAYGDPLPNPNFEFKIINIIINFKPDIILTVGEEHSVELINLSYEWRKRWSHIDSFDKITEHFIEG